MNFKNIITSAFLLSILSCNATIAATYNTIPKTDETIENVQLLEAKNDAFSNSFQKVNKTSSVANLSAVEALFNGKDADLSQNVLRQVGYDLFNAPISASNSSTGKYDNNYKLSIGEKLSLYLYGDSVDVMAISGSNLLSPVVNTEVDSKGNIFVQGIGIVEAEGKTLNEVEKSINTKAKGKYSSLKIKLQVASGRDFSVFVYGQVNHPGKVLISNNSSLMDALGAAGGVKKTGTLRNIQYTSNKKTKSVDLYKAIFAGNDEDIILKPNDKIFVGGIGNVIALKNGVSVKGIYEIKDHESLQQIVNFAGGILPGTQTSEVTLTSLNTETLERSANNINWNEATHKTLKNGDSIEFKELYNTAENTVTIQVNIKHPATYAYKEGMRLSDVLKSQKELLEETFITQAVIRRISKDDNSVETIPVYLKEFFAGINNPVLQPRDIINIYKNTNSEFVDVYGCINNPKHVTYKENMNLEDLLTDIQFVESNVEQKDSNEKNVSFKNNTEQVLVGGTENNNRIISAENVAVEIIGADDSTQLYYLYDIMINGNTIKSISIAPQDKVFFRPLRDNEMIKNVRVSGFVNKPTSYKFIEGKKLVDMIQMAGGLTKDADLRGIVYTRKNLQARQVNLATKNNDRDIKLLEGRIAGGFKQASSDIEAKTNMIQMLKKEKSDLNRKYSGQIALNIKNNRLDKIRDIDNIDVQDGDEIYIPRLSNHVSVIGEVYNEQSFIYKKGSNAKTYIQQVGGYTPNANRFRIYKVGVNGRAEKIGKLAKIEPGDTIIVPRRISGNDWITPVCDMLRGIAALVTSAFVVTKI